MKICCSPSSYHTYWLIGKQIMRGHVFLRYYYIPSITVICLCLSLRKLDRSRWFVVTVLWIITPVLLKLCIASKKIYFINILSALCNNQTYNQIYLIIIYINLLRVWLDPSSRYSTVSILGALRSTTRTCELTSVLGTSHVLLCCTCK